jgi:TM2 domain-containing membrane protein YozV
MLNRKAIDYEEELIRQSVSKLSENKKKKFYTMMEEKIKDPDTYAVLNWFFMAGLHHLYLNRWLKGSINVALFLIGITLILFGDDAIVNFGVGVLFSLFVVELHELFRSQVILREYNNSLSKQILNSLEENS